jgi:hypothetical protein
MCAAILVENGLGPVLPWVEMSLMSATNFVSLARVFDSLQVCEAYKPGTQVAYWMSARGVQLAKLRMHALQYLGSVFNAHALLLLLASAGFLNDAF